MHHSRRRKKQRPNYGKRLVDVCRSVNGFGFTISGQQVIVSIISTLILYYLFILNFGKIERNQFHQIRKLIFWFLTFTTILSTWIGIRPAVHLIVYCSQFACGYCGLTNRWFSHYSKWSKCIETTTWSCGPANKWLCWNDPLIHSGKLFFRHFRRRY